MSGLLAGKVWCSDLEKHLKPLAATMADLGDDEGEGIYPSVAYLAWRLSCSERAVQYGLDELRRAGVLEVLSPTDTSGAPVGGRATKTLHRFHEEHLPQRPPWRKGATIAPFIAERVQSTTERVQSTTEKGEAGCTRSVSRSVSSNREKNRERSDERPSAQPLIAHYHDRWRDTYGQALNLTGKDCGQLKRVVVDYGPGQARQLLDAYFASDDRLAERSRHAVGVFVSMIPRLLVDVAEDDEGPRPVNDYRSPGNRGWGWGSYGRPLAGTHSALFDSADHERWVRVQMDQVGRVLTGEEFYAEIDAGRIPSYDPRAPRPDLVAV